MYHNNKIALTSEIKETEHKTVNLYPKTFSSSMEMVDECPDTLWYTCITSWHREIPHDQ